MTKRIFKYQFSLLHADYANLNHKWNYTGVISPYYRLYYIDEGEGCISNENESLQLTPGYLYLIPSFTFCNLHCQNTLGQYFIQFFEESTDGISLFQDNRVLMKVKASPLDIENFKRMLTINPGRGINRSDNPIVYEKSIYYQEYQQLNHNQHLSKHVETQGIILQLLSKFLSPETFRKPPARHTPSKVLEAMSYIQINLKNELSVRDLAQRANQHPDYFSRLFLKHTGERPIAYINEKRIERAQHLITTTEMLFEQIAIATGFESLPYFTRMFKKLTNITPGQYKDQTKNSYY